LKFTVTPVNPNANSDVSIVENQGRGGVVLTDPNLNPTVTVTTPACTIVRAQPDCLLGGNADGAVPGSEKAAWTNWGKPNCWCYCRQCRGDSDGKKTANRYVALPDLNLLSAGFGKTDAVLKTIPNGICADFDHKATANKRVALPDLNILSTYFQKVDASVPRCNAAPVITGPVNFWCDPTAGCPYTCP